MRIYRCFYEVVDGVKIEIKRIIFRRLDCIYSVNSLKAKLVNISNHQSRILTKNRVCLAHIRNTYFVSNLCEEESALLL